MSISCLLEMQDLVEKLQTDLTESGMQERLDKAQEEHKALMRAELANHAAAMEASKVTDAQDEILAWPCSARSRACTGMRGCYMSAYSHIPALATSQVCPDGE